MYRESSLKLKKNIVTAALALLAALFAIVSASFAWYVYNTAAHTTKVHLAAGSTVSLLISNEYEGPYQSSVELVSDFSGELVPVSTDIISNGFQRCIDFGERTPSKRTLFATRFIESEETEFYKSTLFIKSSSNVGLYIADIGYNDKDEELPISTAIRVGFLVHEPGNNQAVANEYIFEISQAKNPEADYNTIKGYEGCVLDSSKFGTSDEWDVIEFTPYNSDNYCSFNTSTGMVGLKPDSLKISDLAGEGEPVQVDVYIWLEGCDEDCTDYLFGATLENLAISFAGY